MVLMRVALPLILGSFLGASLLAYSPRVDLEAGRYLKTLADAEVQLKADPGDALAWAAKSQSLTALQRYPEALAAAERSLALKPGLADGLEARGLARGAVAVRQRSLASLRNASGALDDLEAAVQADPALVSAWLSLGWAYEELPGILGGSTRKALHCADELRKVNPAKGDLLSGTVLAKEGRWSEAEPFFLRALAAAPGDSKIFSGYLDELASKETRKALGEAEQKRRLVSEARRMLPGAAASARALEGITDALVDAGQPEEAWTAAKDALPKVDAPSLLRLQLGKIAAKGGVHREEALTYLDQVLREPLEGGGGGYPAAHWRKGQILLDLGRKDEARSEAQAVLKLDPKHRGATELLGSLEE